MKNHKTIAGFACNELEEKKSRFICSVNPVDTEDEAINFISTIKSKYWDATHNVFCYHISKDTLVARSSDDGEPSGTAGVPILEIVKKLNVTNLAVVVTRYFGGTLLGTAGLIKAYSKSAKIGIETAKIIDVVLCIEVLLSIEYPQYGKLNNLINAKPYIIKNINYDQYINISMLVLKSEMDLFMKNVMHITSGSGIINVIDEKFVKVDSDGMYLALD